MNRKLVTLLLIILVFGRAFSQKNAVDTSLAKATTIEVADTLMSVEKILLCPPGIWLPLNWTTNFVKFDTVGIWNNYPGNGSTCVGGEKSIEFNCLCSSIYRLIVSPYQNPGLGFFKVFYKPSVSPCTNTNYTTAILDMSWGYILPLDSGINYDILIDYGTYSPSNFMPAYADLAFYHYPIGSVTPSNITPDSLTFSWNNMFHNVEIKYEAVGIPQCTIIATSSPITITGIVPNTKYDFHFRQVCNTNDTWAMTNVSQRTPPVCDSAPIISCDNNVFYPTELQTLSGSFLLNGCISCTMDQTQLIRKFIPDTSGTYGITHVTTAGTGIRKMGVFYKDAALGCNEKNWNFIVCGTDKYVWGANFGPMISGHSYYMLFSVSSCLPVGNFAFNGFKLTCPSPICSSTPTSLNSNALNNNVCIGQPVSLFPNGSMLGTAGIYKWYKDSCSGAIISNTKIITVSPIVTTTYYLQIADSCGVLGCDSIEIAVNQYPNSMLSNTTDTSICYTDSLLIAVNQSLGDSVQWFKNSSPISSATDSTFYIKETGSYFATVTNQFGCKRATDTVNITISKPDNQLNLTGAIAICNGDSVSISAINVATNTYQWSKNEININGAIANNLVVNDSGSYQVFIIDSLGCSIYSDSITVALLDTPQVAINATTAIFCTGDSIKISCVLTDTLAYQWLYNGAPINAATDTFYYAKQMGDYALSVINVCGKSSVSNSINIIQSIPVSTVTPNNLVNVCDGDSISLTATFNQGYAYQWFRNNTLLAGANSNALLLADSGYYFTTIVDTLQCLAFSDTVKITVSKLPDVTLSPAGIISNFVGNYLTLNAQSDSLNSFQWYRNGTLLPYAQSVTCHAYSSGVYLVRVTDLLGCLNYSQTLQLNGISNAINNVVSTKRIVNDSVIEADQIKIFPNPTNGITTIDLSELTGKNISVSISSATGQLIFNHEKYKQKALFIDAAQLSKGVYTLKISGEVNSYKKIIVN